MLRVGRYRFFFFSNEGTEPAHIHVESGGQYAKFWIEPVSLEKSTGYKSVELNEIAKHGEKNAQLIKERWDEHFSR